MKNTIENKQRFFALYVLQEVHRGNRSKHLDHLSVMRNQKFGHLELKPLSEISDDDIEDLMDYFNIKMVSFLKEDVILAIKSQFLEAQNRIPYKYADYLRSRGYLLPFMDLTIEQILEYGWAVLKSK
jgi:hypothetical protein